MRDLGTRDPEGRLRVPHETLIVVCDGEHARLLRNDGTALEPRFRVFDQMEQQNPATGDQVTDRPGRFNDGPTAQRSAAEEVDHHKLNKLRFAGAIADMLRDAALAGAYRDLVLVAPPRVLGELRAQLHHEVRSKLLAEVDKLLTHHSVESIQRAVVQAA